MPSEPGAYRIGEVTRLPTLEDPEVAKYVLVMYGLCKKYGVRSPLAKLVFSVVENMSRGMPCIIKNEKIAEYTGGSVQDIEGALETLAGKDLITKAKFKNTDGWKLTPGVRREANYFKTKIAASRKGSSHN